ncbi:LRC14 protein, partial [Copsychus sechellarum]|nr:LRC14 protein [Copsychus sechellarum]
MDSLLFLCTRHIVAQRPLPALPDDLYPILFQAAFLDGRPLVLRDLVATWPFLELNFQRLVGHKVLFRAPNCNLCIEAVILAVVAQVQRELEVPRHQSSGSWLRVLDMTGVPDHLDGRSDWSSTKALARACVAVSRHQQELQRRRSKRHKGYSAATTAEAALRPPGVDVHADLVVDKNAYGILCEALQPGAASPLRLKCREFQPKYISAFEIVTLLECLDPSCLRRVDLHFICLRLVELLVILPHLSRFPELRSLNLQYSNLDMQHPTPESAIRIRCVARQLGMLSGLRDLNLRTTGLSGNLRQILCNLQAPLESLDLGHCSLLPTDLAFLSQSFHPAALKRLDLSGQDISQGLLEPLRLLLEETSASLLYLDLMECCMSDSHLAVLLPTLLRCSRLRVLGLFRNPLSTAALKDLLQKTLKLPDLHLVVYPIPLDCHTREPSEFDCYLFDESADEELLSAAEVEFSQLLANSRRTNLVWTDDPQGLEALDYFSL